MRTPKRKTTDWAAVEADFRAGIIAIREVGRRHGVSHTAVNKRAAAEGWVRATPILPVISPPSTQKPAAAAEKPAQRIPAAADVKSAIAVARDLTNRLAAELDVDTLRIEEIEELIHLETMDDQDGGRRRRMMLKAVSLPSRATTLKMLSAAAKGWDEMERRLGNPDPAKPAPADQPAAKPLSAASGWDDLLPGAAPN
jgi:hypothetical protein